MKLEGGAGDLDADLACEARGGTVPEILAGEVEKAGLYDGVEAGVEVNVEVVECWVSEILLSDGIR